jgi:hypothetical protein
MMGEVELAALEIVAQALRNMQAKLNWAVLANACRRLESSAAVCSKMARTIETSGRLSSPNSPLIDAVFIPSSASSMCGSATCL